MRGISVIKNSPTDLHKYLLFLLFSLPQTLVPPSAPQLPAVNALIGAALPTGSSVNAWVASIQPTSLRSTSSMTYLKAQGSASASSMLTPTTVTGTTRAAPDTIAWVVEEITAAAVYSRFAVKLATVSCWARSQMGCGCTIAASSQCLSTHLLWTQPILGGWA